MNVQRSVCAFVVIAVSLFLSYRAVIACNECRCQIKLLNEGHRSLLPKLLTNYVFRVDVL